MKPEAIYGLRKNGEWVYVGRSVNIMDRVHAHRARGIDFDSVVTLAIVARESSELVEERAISILKPTRNVRADGRGRHASTGPASARIVFSLSRSDLSACREMAASDNRSLSSWFRATFRRLAEVSA